MIYAILLKLGISLVVGGISSYIIASVWAGLIVFLVVFILVILIRPKVSRYQ